MEVDKVHQGRGAASPLLTSWGGPRGGYRVLCPFPQTPPVRFLSKQSLLDVRICNNCHKVSGTKWETPAMPTTAALLVSSRPEIMLAFNAEHHSTHSFIRGLAFCVGYEPAR